MRVLHEEGVFWIETTPPLRIRQHEAVYEPKARTFCPLIADFVKSEFGLSSVSGPVYVKSYAFFYDKFFTDIELFSIRAFANLHASLPQSPIQLLKKSSPSRFMSGIAKIK